MEFIDLKTQYKRYKKDIDTRLHGVLDTGAYIMGPEVQECEEKLAEFVNTKHCITASSGTDTLLMALMALGVGRGDEVITTPFTWISTVEVISFLGATPVFVDIEEESLNINVNAIEAAITPKTKAILPVNLFGLMIDYLQLNKISEKHGIPVIEDAAQSFGAKRDGIQSCNATTIGSTSFYPAKPLGCYGDGGALFTNDDELALALKSIRNHGCLKRYHHTELGINGRFDAMQAAVINAKLPHFQSEVIARERIGKRYTTLLEGIAATPVVPENAVSTYAMYTIRVKNRDQVQADLKERGIPSAVYYPLPCYEQPAYRQYKVAGQSFPVTEKVCEEVLSLPMHAFLTESDQDKVVDALKEVITKESLV